MVIRVKGYLTFHKLLGERWVEANKEETLRTLLEKLAVELGDPFARQVFARQGGLRRQVAVLVNGRSYARLPEGLERNPIEGWR
jgi:hypothetical protein